MQAYYPSSIASLPLAFEEYLRLRIRKLIGLKHNALWSPLAIFQSKLIPINHSRKHQLALVTSVPPSRASMPANAELHLRLGYRCKLVLLLVLHRGLPKVVEAQTVEDIRIWVVIWIEVNRVRGGKCKGARRYIRPVRKSDRL